ncbi:general stress protein [Neobacillus terrae]|uniref:general stress protein n=1 Tax=Neobacillus terrae TaxID=3034837 RepID=UPI00140D670F|nr:general stress protein [Neobacillus terrae]NHM30150.1 general stress protein [Neobacillus terrae]
MPKVEVVENGVHALEKIQSLQAAGYQKDDIHLFAHYEKREEDLTKELQTAEMGIGDQGLMNSIGNMFKKRGDELRSQFEALGLSQQEADTYEKELDNGRLVLVAAKE